ncbi:hypothetical protein ACFPM7_15865 [Actinokineospora guangxiensis]|uniref:Uncharacterized protein n=1 Tax=Actinokineospora guangxiensis TaxID=1490288 RepID=A0ABW0EP55_9PSEU
MTVADPVALAALVAALPQVAGLHSGRYGEITTLLPGRRVLGVRVRDDDVTIGVVARYPVPVAEVAAAVRAAVAPVAVDVWVGDVCLDPTQSGLVVGETPIGETGQNRAVDALRIRFPARTS